MKSFSLSELKSYVQWIFPQLTMAQLQDVWTDGRVVVLEFYKSTSLWLCFDLSLAAPTVVLCQEKPAVGKTPKPLSLFLLAHGRNLRLHEITVDEEKGRILNLLLLNHGRECEIQAQLIPKNVNLQAVVRSPEEKKEKKISWAKPRLLPPATHQEPSVVSESVDWSNHAIEWLESLRQPSGKSAGKSTDPMQKFLHDLEKKRKAADEIFKQLQSHQEDSYRQLGEILKYPEMLLTDERSAGEEPEAGIAFGEKIRSLLPQSLQSLYNLDLSLGENRERVFQKAKDILRKRSGSEARLQELQKQISLMESQLQTGDVAALEKPKPSLAAAVLKKADSKARKLSLSEGFEAVIGKSAKDNLAILRQARSWDFWFHLRDFPGAHAILFRNKNQNVADGVIGKVAEWIIAEFVGKRQLPAGVKYDVAVVECRFVRPVKGGTGLVTYQNSRTFTLVSK